MVLVNIGNRRILASVHVFSSQNSVLSTQPQWNRCVCEQIEGFVPRNRKDNDGPDHDFLEQDNNGSYNTRSSISLEVASRIPGTYPRIQRPHLDIGWSEPTTVLSIAPLDRRNALRRLLFRFSRLYATIYTGCSSTGKFGTSIAKCCPSAPIFDAGDVTHNRDVVVGRNGELHRIKRREVFPETILYLLQTSCLKLCQAITHSLSTGQGGTWSVHFGWPRNSASVNANNVGRSSRNLGRLEITQGASIKHVKMASRNALFTVQEHPRLPNRLKLTVSRRRLLIPTLQNTVEMDAAHREAGGQG
ncbi:hypothetical protein K443DRAFT_14245 [Laccaria amethystina LaAM-08-1]|uniref:Uncharacterized protein n=1 Tax=Laccaria amethystina LaAM-08-1 TaxID=1095629 RepID=A0A0C9WN40_9AGAR|nr:hypothetical protein K443DRAFT_14245 [Laccaria amethystina LaAM-08-1]